MQRSNPPHNPNHSKITAAAAGLKGKNLPGLLNGKKGIYSLVVTDPAWGATGHADLLYSNSICGVNCYFTAPIARLDVWVLQ